MAQGQSIGNAYLTVKAQPDKSFKSELDKAGSSAGESSASTRKSPPRSPRNSA